MISVKSMLSQPPFLLAPLCIALAACGGSSNGSSDGERYNTDTTQTSSTETTETVERVSLTGLAVKGIVHGAKAELFRVIDGAVEDTAFATGNTDDEGRYELTVVSQETYAGPALVRISWQSGAEMTCDADAGCGTYTGTDPRDSDNSGTIDFSERFDLDTDFEMAVLIPQLTTSNESDHIVTAHVSSLTHMAAKLAQSGLISEAAANSANNQIRAVLGLDDDIDIVITPPLDVSGSTQIPGSAEYGAITAAIAEIAHNRGISISEALSAIVVEFLQYDGQLLWNDNGDLTGISIEEVATAALAIAELLGNNDLVTRFQALISMANMKDADTPSDIHPPIADAGTDQTVSAGAAVTLNGSNQEEGTSSYEWLQISGTPVSLSSTSTQQTTFTTSPLASELTFRLTVTNQATEHSDIDYVKVTVSSANVDSQTLTDLNNTQYTLWNPLVYFSAESQTTSESHIGYGLEVEKTLTLETTGNDPLSLSLIPSGNIQLWSMQNTYQDDVFFSGSLARSNTETQLDGTAEIGTTTALAASIDSLEALSVQLPQTSEQDGDLTELSLAGTANLIQVAPGSWFGAHVDQTDFFTAADADQTNKTPIQSEYFISTPMLVQDTSDFSETQMATQYGVISIGVGADTTLSHIVSTELQQWDITSDVSGVMTAIANSLDDQDSLGNQIVTYTHQLDYADDTDLFSVSSTPYSVDIRTDAPEREDIEINFSVRDNGQLRVPSSLLDNVFESDQVALEGVASSDGQLLMAQLMGEPELGMYEGFDITAIAYERYLALATSDSAPELVDLTDTLFQIQGLLFDVSASGRGVATSAATGSLQFGDGTATLSLNTDTARLQNVGFTVNRSQSSQLETNDTLVPVLAANGYLKFNVGDLTLEGFMNDDGTTLILRALDSNLLSGKAQHATQGFLIARKVD